MHHCFHCFFCQKYYYKSVWISHSMVTNVTRSMLGFFWFTNCQNSLRFFDWHFGWLIFFDGFKNFSLWYAVGALSFVWCLYLCYRCINVICHILDNAVQSILSCFLYLSIINLFLWLVLCDVVAKVFISYFVMCCAQVQCHLWGDGHCVRQLVLVQDCIVALFNALYPMLRVIQTLVLENIQNILLSCKCVS